MLQQHTYVPDALEHPYSSAHRSVPTFGSRPSLQCTYDQHAAAAYLRSGYQGAPVQFSTQEYAYVRFTTTVETSVLIGVQHTYNSASPEGFRL